MMKLDAPGRDVPSSPAVLRLPPAALLVVAGVPGAGKTTLLSRVDAPGSLVLDPEPIRTRLRRLLGPLPYRAWRPLVHAEHGLRVLFALPGRRGLLVHDTGTRSWRRRDRQRQGRAIRRSAFATHWRNWRRLRAGFPPQGDPSGLHAEGWASVRLLDRPAADRLVRVVIPGR